jgi:hypothetical protein
MRCGGGLRVLLPTMPDAPSDVEYPEVLRCKFA